MFLTTFAFSAGWTCRRSQCQFQLPTRGTIYLRRILRTRHASCLCLVISHFPNARPTINSPQYFRQTQRRSSSRDDSKLHHPPTLDTSKLDTPPLPNTPPPAIEPPPCTTLPPCTERTNYESHPCLLLSSCLRLCGTMSNGTNLPYCTSPSASSVLFKTGNFRRSASATLSATHPSITLTLICVRNPRKSNV